MNEQHIHDEGTFGKYFHIILNMADDDLDPFEYRLLGHYRRVCGDDGYCNEAIETTAKRCRMSLAKARTTRKALRKQGYIRFDDKTAGVTLNVTLVNRMEENVKRYTESVKSDTPIRSDSPTPIESKSPPLSDSIAKEEPIKNNQDQKPITVSSPISKPKERESQDSKGSRKNAPPKVSWYVFCVINDKNVYLGPAPTKTAAEEYARGHGTLTMNAPDGAAIMPWPRVMQPAELLDTWIVAFGKENLPAGFKYGPCLRFMKDLLKDGVKNLTCAGELYRAWADAQSGKPTLTWTVDEVILAVRRALGLCSSAVTAADIHAFVRDKRGETDLSGNHFWNGKLMSFKFVADNITSWKADQTPERPAQAAPKLPEHRLWFKDPTTGRDLRYEPCTCSLGHDHDA